MSDATAVELQDFSEKPRLSDEQNFDSQDFGMRSTLLYHKGFLNAKETPQAVELSVSGELPSWLNGELFTVGPGTYDIKYNKMIEVGNGEYESGTVTFSMGHWFDGLPLVNRFVLDGETNKIIYRSKHVSKKYESKVRDRHGIVTTHPFSLFKTHVNQTPLAKLMMKKRTSKPELEPCSAYINASFPLSKAGEKPKLYCQNHASQVVELDAHDLTPTRVYSWNELNPLFKGDHAAPHSHYDSTTGELINFNMEYHPLGTKYNFFSLSETQPSGDLIASITAKASYVHSFAVTPRFIILVIFPFYGRNAGLNFKWSDNILDSFVFRPEDPTLFYVISRTKKKHVSTYKSDACFAFHHINAFEDDEDNVYIDIASYENDEILNFLNLRELREGFIKQLPLAEIRRFALLNIELESVKFDAQPQASQVEILQNTVSTLFTKRTPENQTSIYPYPIANYVRCSDSALELPSINPYYQRLRYRYVYGIGFSAKAAGQVGQIWDSLVKCDLDTKEAVGMWSQEDCYPSEAIFVPVPESTEEDEGILLSIVFNGKENKSFLLVLDAKTLREIAIAHLPEVIPLSFGHSSFKELHRE
ncbi:10958_t:CDS:2 [Ambispora gerdemannii]|uniref:10958_t:CDS:1 n=1 Tax=Ambispora gerdemannii TaxID=144530 RepID=A0A9N9AV25_9GLOM|nr:10958_t:CDS:2 [Ambispora gerdemannii]